MPKEIHRRLVASAKKHGFKKGSKRYNRYVYGTLAKIEKARKKRKRS